MRTLVAGLTLLALLSTGECDQHDSTARIDEYGESSMLDCPVLTGYVFNYWILPDVQTTVDASYTGNMVEYISRNHSLYIRSVEKEHLGDYICRTSDQAGLNSLYFKTTLYLYVPSIWEEYRQNVIVGSIAAACCLVFFTIICAIDTIRTDRRERRRDKRLSELEHQMEMSGAGQSSYPNLDAPSPAPPSYNGVTNHGYTGQKYLASDGSLVINTKI